MKVRMKSSIFCIRSVFENEFEYAQIRKVMFI